MLAVTRAPSRLIHTVGPFTPSHPIPIIALIPSCSFSTTGFRVGGQIFFRMYVIDRKKTHSNFRQALLYTGSTKLHFFFIKALEHFY